MPSPFTIRSVDVGYGNTKFTVDDRGTLQLFPSLAPRADVERARACLLRDRRTRVVCVDGQSFEVGPDSILFPDVSILHRDYTETPEYRALLYGALDAMEVRRIDLLVTGLPVYLHHSRAQRLKELLTGEHQIREHTELQIRQVIVVPQPLGGLVAHSLEQPDGSRSQAFTRLHLDPGYFSFDWLLTRGMTEVPGVSSSLEGGVSEILRSVQHEISRDLGESYSGLRRLDQGLREGLLQLSGRTVDLKPYRAVAQAVAARAVRLMRNQLRHAREIDEVVLSGGGASYFEDSVREEFPDRPVQVVEEPVFANVRGFQAIGNLMRQRRPRRRGTLAH